MPPKIRQTIYAIGLIATSALSILSVWRVIDPTTASTVSAALSGVLSLLGVGAAGTAAVVISKQQKNGTFDVSGSTAEQAIQAINNTVQQAQQATSDLQKVRDAVSGVIKDIPVLGPYGAQIFDQATK